MWAVRKKRGHELEVNKDKLTPMRKNWKIHGQLLPTLISTTPSFDDMVDLLEKLVPVKILLHTPG